MDTGNGNKSCGFKIYDSKDKWTLYKRDVYEDGKVFEYSRNTRYNSGLSRHFYPNGEIIVTFWRGDKHLRCGREVHYREDGTVKEYVDHGPFVDA